jgi:hypothetical protein
MDKKLKNKWVKALESGKYSQGKRALKNNQNEYCCLGVLLEVAGKKFTYGNTNQQMLCGYKQKWTGTLPTSFQKKWGIPDAVQDNCMVMNDLKGWSFKEIAKWIRKNV